MLYEIIFFTIVWMRRPRHRAVKELSQHLTKSTATVGNPNLLIYSLFLSKGTFVCMVLQSFSQRAQKLLSQGSTQASPVSGKPPELYIPPIIRPNNSFSVT